MQGGGSFASVRPEHASRLGACGRGLVGVAVEDEVEMVALYRGREQRRSIRRFGAGECGLRSGRPSPEASGHQDRGHQTRRARRKPHLFNERPRYGKRLGFVFEVVSARQRVIASPEEGRLHFGHECGGRSKEVFDIELGCVVPLRCCPTNADEDLSPSRKRNLVAFRVATPALYHSMTQP